MGKIALESEANSVGGLGLPYTTNKCCTAEKAIEFGCANKGLPSNKLIEVGNLSKNLGTYVVDLGTVVSSLNSLFFTPSSVVLPPINASIPNSISYNKGTDFDIYNYYLKIDLSKGGIEGFSNNNSSPIVLLNVGTSCNIWGYKSDGKLYRLGNNSYTIRNNTGGGEADRVSWGTLVG